MGSRLVEAHLGREQRQAVAGGCRQEDAGDVQGVQDFRGRVPQPGGGQEIDVEARAVADRLAAAQEVGQFPQCGIGARRASQFLLPDPCQPEHGFGHWAPWIHQAFESRRHSFGGEGDRAHLDHSISGRVKSGRLEIEGCVFGHRLRILRKDVRSGVLSGAAVAIFAPDANRGDRGTQATGGPSRTA